MKTFKTNAVTIGALFIFTTLVGMIDAYFVAPALKQPVTGILHLDSTLLLGAFSVLIMAVGIVFIAIAFFPVVKRQSEIVALTYLSLRIVECLLLVVGTICYLYITALSRNAENVPFNSGYPLAIAMALKIKYFGFQIAMTVLGFGSLFLCYSLYKSRVVPAFLSVWGGIGYLLLLTSAVLDVCGVIDTTNGLGSLLYIPGGLWEMLVFPLWLFIKGFNVQTTLKEEK